MQTADFYSSATGTLRVNGGKDENAPRGVSLSIDDLSYIKQGSRANDAEPVTDYDLLDNKPQINNIILTGNKSLNDLGIQPKIDSSHKVSADNVDDTDATNKFATAAQLAQITTNQNNISLVDITNNFTAAEGFTKNTVLSKIYKQGKHVFGKLVLEINSGTMPTVSTSLATTSEKPSIPIVMVGYCGTNAFKIGNTAYVFIASNSGEISGYDNETNNADTAININIDYVVS